MVITERVGSQKNLLPVTTLWINRNPLVTNEFRKSVSRSLSLSIPQSQTRTVGQNNTENTLSPRV
jgi:hypothetical protein